MVRADTLSVAFWWFGGGDTPVLIPNTAVKLASVDDSPSGQK